MLLPLCISFVSALALAANSKPGITIPVELHPVGDFTLVGDGLSGMGSKVGPVFEAQEFKLDVSSLKTGNSLRDDHLQKKYLKSEAFPFIFVRHVKAKDGKGTATLTVRNKTEAITFTYQDHGLKGTTGLATATFALKISTFVSETIGYLGVGVVDDITVTATLPYQVATSKSTAPSKGAATLKQPAAKKLKTK